MGDSSTTARSASSTSIVAYDDGRREPRFDDVANEEPLQLRLATRGETRDVAITMRTPGNDFELAAGFLFSEG
ncbi:MAG: sulfurtransferase FdhD, partial [Candidatus Eremiobacteraeota bacterium]|nr:sulfurtransferase FdhD [Candidatus Eremiobacteraeota bacterium]